MPRPTRSGSQTGTQPARTVEASNLRSAPLWSRLRPDRSPHRVVPARTDGRCGRILAAHETGAMVPVALLGRIRGGTNGPNTPGRGWQGSAERVRARRRALVGLSVPAGSAPSGGGGRQAGSERRCDLRLHRPDGRGPGRRLRRRRARTTRRPAAARRARQPEQRPRPALPGLPRPTPRRRAARRRRAGGREVLRLHVLLQRLRRRAHAGAGGAARAAPERRRR